MLIPQYEVSFDLASRYSTGKGGEVDLIITDGSSLKTNAQRISLERQLHEPVIVPVLLLSDRQSVSTMTQSLWRIIDDVVLRPLEKAEMRTRIESLVRARRLSQKLYKISGDYQHERRVAQRFQKAALPRTLPQIPGLRFCSFYRPGTDEANVGGDWYDAIELTDGRVMFSIGDVCGSGLDAAVAMASVRQVFRGAAHFKPTPDMLLEAAHWTLQQQEPESLVTAFVGILDLESSQISYASAGHPPPLLRLPDGTVMVLPTSGGPLGLPFPTERTLFTTTMPVGSLLVLYTDGLTEANRDPVAGENDVRAALRKPDVINAPNVAFALHDTVLYDGARDDVAVLTVAHIDHDAARGPLRHWTFDSRDAESAHEVRREILDELKLLGFRPHALANANLIFGELLGNVVRYAPKWVAVTLDCAETTATLHVLDKGPGFTYTPGLPDDPFSESGRGLHIVSQLAKEFSVSRRAVGGSHVRAVLAGSSPS